MVISTFDPMSTTTGAQLEIADGDLRAVVTEYGAGLRLFEVAGVPYLDGYGPDEKPPLGAGCVLVPWPNRVAAAHWAHGDLVPTEQARGNAIHGLVRRTGWEVLEHATGLVRLGVTVDPQPGWPFAFRTTIAYELRDGGLAVTHEVHNLSEREMPFGVGAHPYPRPGKTDVDDCVLTLAATSILPLDQDTMIPSGPATPVRRPEIVLRGTDLDTPFGGCLPGEDGLVTHTLSGPDGGVAVWADPDFRWVQVFTPPAFPGKGDLRAVAIEPMTCPPDALNSGEDLLTVGPGQSWRGTWGIRPLLG